MKYVLDLANTLEQNPNTELINIELILFSKRSCVLEMLIPCSLINSQNQSLKLQYKFCIGYSNIVVEPVTKLDCFASMFFIKNF